MITQADVDAVVGAFKEDLADLVRRIALEAVFGVLGEPLPEQGAASRSRAAAATKARTRPATAPKPRAPVASRAPRATSRSAEAEAEAPRVEHTPAEAADAAPLPPPIMSRKLDPQRRGRVVMLPSSPPPAPIPADIEAATVIPHNVVPVRVPTPTPRRRGPARVKVAAPEPAAAAAPTEPVPARNWVVVRRPARERTEGADQAADGNTLPAVTE